MAIPEPAVAGALRGKIALVTGASRRIGIGAAIARELAAAGADVFITFHRPYDAAQPWGSDPAEAEALLAELRALNVRAGGAEIDLADPAAPAALVDRVEAALGPVHVLVNNAAHSEPGGISSLDAAQLDRHYTVNVRATALLSVEFARRFRAASGGRIINLTSGQGKEPMPDELAYAATKGAIDAFTISLSAALAPRGITVNAIDPGPTDTGWMPPDLRAELERRAPMQRVGRPQDAASLACFLASDAAAWITGQILRSRGGM